MIKFLQHCNCKKGKAGGCCLSHDNPGQPFIAILQTEDMRQVLSELKPKLIQLDSTGNDELSSRVT
jgi:hypothetical protein